MPSDPGRVLPPTSAVTQYEVFAFPHAPDGSSPRPRRHLVVVPREHDDGPWQVMLTDLDEPGVVWWGLSILSLLALQDLCSKHGATAEVTLEARKQMHDAGIWGSQSRTRPRHR